MKWYPPWDNPLDEYDNVLDEYDKKFKKAVEDAFFDPSYDETVDDYNTRIRMLVGGVPVIGDFERSYDNYRYYDDYLRNRGMSWNDVRYPTRLNAGLNGAFGTLNYVSKNIVRLYR